MKYASLRFLLLAGLCAVVVLAGCSSDDSVNKPAPEADWSNEGIVWTAPYSPDGESSTLEFLKIGNMVHLKGFGNAVSTHVQSGQIIATLPAACRPPAGTNAVLLCPTWGWPGAEPGGYVGTAGVMVYDDGRIEVRTVQQYDGQQQFINFDGVCFSTASGADGWLSDGLVWSAPYAADGPYPSSLEYCRIGTTVRLQGYANAGGTHVQNGQQIGTLPEGYRPPAGETAYLPCATWGWPSAHAAGYVGSAGVQVFPDGRLVIRTVQQYPGEQQFLMLDGMSFSTVSGAEGWSAGDIAWTVPFTLAPPYPSALELKKDGDRVLMRGFVNAGSTHVQEEQVVCTLPDGHRAPAGHTRILLCPTWGWPSGYPDGYVGAAGVFVFDDGSVRVKTVQQFPGVQQFLIFDGRSFSTTD